jgi:ATP-binding cassette subfamily F protein uup
VVAGPARQPDWTDAALLERFWFDTDTQWAPIRLLSGGERRRLQLVLVLRQGPNVLLLDEPTNDLDLDTLRALEDLLETWPGALVAVSHDRAFLERTVDDVLVLDGEGGAGRIAGGYAAYEAERRARRRTGARPGTATMQASAGGRSARTRRASGSTADAPAVGPGTLAGPGPAASGSSAGRPRTRSTLRHLLRRAESQLAELQKRQESLEAEVAVAAEDHAALARLGADLAGLQAELALAEEAWLALAEEAESVGLSP